MYKRASSLFAVMTIFSVVGLVITHILKRGLVVTGELKGNTKVVVAGNRRFLKKGIFKIFTYAAPLWLGLRIKSALTLQKRVKRRKRLYTGIALLIGLGMLRNKKNKKSTT